MVIVGTIAVLAFIALVRIVLMRRYASQIRGQSEKEELINTLVFARNRPIVGGLLIGLWIMQCSLVVLLFVILVWSLNRAPLKR